MKKGLKILKFILSHPLAGKHKLRALFRFFEWQFSQTLFPGMVQYTFIGHTKFWVKKGMTAATANIYTGLHEFSEMSFLLHFLRPGDVFVDVGANIGAYSLLASGAAGARTVTIEPVPSTFEILGKNISLNQLGDKVSALNMGVGSTESSLYFTQNEDSVNHVVLDPGNEKNELVKVPVSTLDEILENEPCPSLVKIDVEGFEHEVIKGASGILGNQNLKAVIIELIGEGQRYGFDEEQVHKKLLDYHFKTYEYLPFKRELSELKERRPGNMVYVRDIEFVRKRISGSKPIHIFSENF